MFFNNLIENNYFSDKEPNKKDLIKSGKFNIVTVYFKKNQEIPAPSRTLCRIFLCDGR